MSADIVPGAQLIDRVAVITGGTSGIGAASARLFARHGARVVIAGRDVAAGDAIAREIGRDALFVRTDVAEEDDIVRLIDTAVGRWGRLDVMFNNAGMLGALGPIAQTDTADLDRTIAVNLRGTILGIKHAARVMIPQRSGSILVTSSPGGMIGGVGPHVYSATKGGLFGLVGSVAAELRTTGIRVNAIVPGSVVSAMTAEVVAGGRDRIDAANATMDETKLMPRTLQPEDVAEGALFLASDQSRMVTGISLPVDAGYTGARGSSPFATGAYAEGARMVGDVYRSSASDAQA